MNIFGIKIERQRKPARAAPGTTTKGVEEIPKGARRRIRIQSFFPRWLRGDYTLRNSDLIFSAVSRISNALSAMPVVLYKGSDLVRNDLSYLISVSPNPNMTCCQLIKTMEACRDTAGNAYALKQYDEQMILTRVDVLNPDRVTPIMEKNSGELWYHITPESGVEYYIHNFYIIHIPFISTNGYTGVNPVSVLQNTLEYNAGMQKFSASQLEKGVNAQIVVEAPANLGDMQRENMIASLMDTYKDTDGNILLLESGVTAKALNLSPVDSKIFEVEKIARSRVATVYNIPPHLLGDYSDTSFSSQEQQMLEFLSLTMLPIVTAYEQEFDRKLLTREEIADGYHFKFNMDSILRADSATRAEVNQKAIRGGWAKPNEVRSTYNMPKDPNGDKLLVSRDLTTLEYLVEHPEKGENGSGQPQNSGKEEK